MKKGFLFLSILVFVAGCRPKYSASEPPVILISLDTVRADHLSGYGYFRETTPAIDRFGREGVVFTRAYTPMPHTLPAHVTMLTSRYPREHGVLYNGWMFVKDMPTLQAALVDKGYATAAVVGSSILNRGTGLDAGFDHFNDEFAHKIKIHKPKKKKKGIAYRSPAEVVVEKAQTWIDGQDLSRPFFLFLHFYDAHPPFDLLPKPFRHKFADDERFQKEMADRGIGKDHHKDFNRYDGSLSYLDENLAAFFRFLQKRDIYDRALIVLVADHGEGCGEHDYFGHGMFLYEEQIHVPFIIRFPGGEHAGARLAPAISLLDIVPTILAFLKMPGLDGQRGRNLQPLIAGGKAAAAPPLVIQRRYYSEETGGEPGKFRPGDAFSIADGTMKYILWAEGPDELYDLASDPGEFVNLLEKNPEAGADLRAQIEGFVRSIPQRMTKPREMSQEKIDQLRALGYIQ